MQVTSLQVNQSEYLNTEKSYNERVRGNLLSDRASEHLYQVGNWSVGKLKVGTPDAANRLTYLFMTYRLQDLGLKLPDCELIYPLSIHIYHFKLKVSPCKLLSFFRNMPTNMKYHSP